MLNTWIACHGDQATTASLLQVLKKMPEATNIYHKLVNIVNCTVLYTVTYCRYCTILFCTVLYFPFLFCIVLYCTLLYCFVQYCTIVYAPGVTSLQSMIGSIFASFSQIYRKDLQKKKPVK